MSLLSKILHKAANKFEPEIRTFLVIFTEGEKEYTYHRTHQDMTEILNKKWYEDDSLPFSVLYENGSKPSFTLEIPPPIVGYECKRCGMKKRKKMDECSSCGSYMISVIRKD